MSEQTKITWQIECSPEQHSFAKQEAENRGQSIGEYISAMVEPTDSLSLEEQRESLLNQLSRLNDQVGKQQANEYTHEAHSLMERAGLLLEQARESDTVALAEAQARVEQEREGQRQELLGKLAALDVEYLRQVKNGLKILQLQDVPLSHGELAFLGDDSANADDCSSIPRRRYSQFPDKIGLNLANIRAKISLVGRRISNL